MMKGLYGVGTALLIALLICAASVSQAQSFYLPGATGHYYGYDYGDYAPLASNGWWGGSYYPGQQYTYSGFALRPYYVGVRGFLVTAHGLAPLGILDSSPLFGWGHDDYNSNYAGSPTDSSGLPTVDQDVVTGSGVEFVDTPRSSPVYGPQTEDADQLTHIVYDPDTVTVASGTVVSLDSGQPGDIDPESVWAVLATQSGTRINVALAPDTFLKDQKLILSPGDSVTVLGSLARAGNTSVIVAREVRRTGGGLLNLRDAEGNAVWNTKTAAKVTASKVTASK